MGSLTPYEEWMGGGEEVWGRRKGGSENKDSYVKLEKIVSKNLNKKAKKSQFENIRKSIINNPSF